MSWLDKIREKANAWTRGETHLDDATREEFEIQRELRELEARINLDKMCGARKSRKSAPCRIDKNHDGNHFDGYAAWPNEVSCRDCGNVRTVKDSIRKDGTLACTNCRGTNLLGDKPVKTPSFLSLGKPK